MISKYNLCDGTGLVCENHPQLAWAGASDGSCVCDCGAGMQCSGCISCDSGSDRHGEDAAQTAAECEAAQSGGASRIAQTPHSQCSKPREDK